MESNMQQRHDISEIEAFMNEWDNRLPVVIVPTKYYQTPTSKFRSLGINTVIWANHMMRSAISAMENTARRIYEDETLQNIEDSVVSVGQVFDLMDMKELKEAEAKYLPPDQKKCKAIILAASQGEKLGDLTANIPKTLLKVRGKSILDHTVELFNKSNHP